MKKFLTKVGTGLVAGLKALNNSASVLVAGLACIGIGTALINIPLALIVVGILLTTLWVFVAWAETFLRR
jgi:hypothetical protein